MSSPSSPSSLSGKAEVVVGIGEVKVAKEPGAMLTTHALGSCIGVAVHCSRPLAAGLLHLMLPTAPKGEVRRPAMYADTGLPLLMQMLERLGCRRGDLVVKLAGGGVFNDPTGFFAVGQRNVKATLDVLRDLKLVPVAQDVGGQKSRTVRLDVVTGAMMIRSRGEEYKL